ncbi:MAG: hypothetical protein Q9160_002738 [Pyrenula sp. 1 TL-2023]
MLLVHDLLFSKSGIAAPSNHPLRLAVERHKARLQAELTRSRLRRSCATLEQLKTKLTSKGSVDFNIRNKIQWVRMNTTQTSLECQLNSTFRELSRAGDLSSLFHQQCDQGEFYVDECIPDLIAIPRSFDVTKSVAYSNGEVVLQDKASCFPSYLLLKSPIHRAVGKILDACAAPGNKTTHLAMLQDRRDIRSPGIIACERDKFRTKTLETMVKVAKADQFVTILGNTDFLSLKADDSSLANVTHLLLDPSCSGSGITGRDNIPSLALPHDSRSMGVGIRGSKKRKHGDNDETAEDKDVKSSISNDVLRLRKLSNLQTHVLTHAFSFPAANTIVYSTCSIHVVENEGVVSRALASNVARVGGWRVMRRDEQVPGLSSWTQRGQRSGDHDLKPWELEGCLRCNPDDGSGTIGFFTCAFVRDAEEASICSQRNDCSNFDEWEGLSDGSRN